MPAEAYRLLVDSLAARGVDVESVKAALKAQHIETPSWGYGDSGTRFKVFRQAGAARTAYEKLDDAAQVHKYTGVAPSVALHIPWDKVDDYGELQAYAGSLRPHAWAPSTPTSSRMTPTSWAACANPDAAVRRQAIDHCLECVEIAKTVGSQRHQPLAGRRHQLPRPGPHPRPQAPPAGESLHEIYAAMPAPMRLLIEYKFFEPAFYHTDLGDWGMSLPDVPQARRARAGAGRPGAPSAGHQHRADRRAAARRGPAGRVPLQQQKVRRRRPHRRLDQPLRAVPDLQRAGRRRAATPRWTWTWPT